MLSVDGKEKPSFTEGQVVYFDVCNRERKGKVKGIASSGPIDIWIIEEDRDDPWIDRSMYEFSCFTMPHTLLRAEKKMPLKKRATVPETPAAIAVMNK